MLRWKTADTREAILQMQQAVAAYRDEVDWRQCHYYVTEVDIAAELGKKAAELEPEDATRVLEAVGLNLYREVYPLSLAGSEGVVGYFAPESALKRLGISLPSWKIYAEQRGRKPLHGAAMTGAQRQARFRATHRKLMEPGCGH